MQQLRHANVATSWISTLKFNKYFMARSIDKSDKFNRCVMEILAAFSRQVQLIRNGKFSRHEMAGLIDNNSKF